ncbi:Protein ViaA [Moorella thermoacetica]|uniref:Protein ViaA n=1 Tax=Neomoorella thermoacetica TaxID=1525 RepID=A0AAC9HIW1_NEOTH|nr:VWA domain-containing protein [Moorella thermoacetica]AOQ24581.1 hypothetical protein Maut_02151 [Moorella thermoacetica]TYL12682.1 Protein ViaA [Moorella thermoacetica]
MYGHRPALTVLNTDKYDRRLYASLKEKTDKLSEMEERLSQQDMPLASIMLQDLWAGLYKSQPQVLEDVPPELKVNQQIMKEAMKLPKFEELRQFTMLDELAAALGAVVLGEKIVDLIPNSAHDAFRIMQKTQKFIDQAAGLLEMATMVERRGQDGSDYRDCAVSLQQRAERMMQEAQKRLDMAVQAIEQWQKNKALKCNLKMAMEDLREKLEAASLFWGTTPGVPRSINSKEKFQLAQRLVKEAKLWEIAKLAGRMTRIALHKRRTKVRKIPQVITGINQGNDLSRILPAELHLLAHPLARKDFLRRFIEGKLLQYELQGRESLGRGPIIACIDSSGSMQGNREIWAKAVALALFQVAVKEKRTFAWINFSTRACSKFQCADPRQVNPLQLAEAAVEDCGGGTNYEYPLEEALQIINQSAFNKADIIFITDGQCKASDQFLQRFLTAKHEKEFCVHTILINSEAPGAHIFSDIVVYYDGKDDSMALQSAFSLD